MRVRGPGVRRDFGDPFLDIDKTHLPHPPRQAMGDAELSGWVCSLSGADIEITPVLQGIGAEFFGVFRGHGPVVAFGFRVEFMAFDVTAGFEMLEYFSQQVFE